MECSIAQLEERWRHHQHNTSSLGYSYMNRCGLNFEFRKAQLFVGNNMMMPPATTSIPIMLDVVLADQPIPHAKRKPPPLSSNMSKTFCLQELNNPSNRWWSTGSAMWPAPLGWKGESGAAVTCKDTDLTLNQHSGGTNVAHRWLPNGTVMALGRPWQTPIDPIAAPFVGVPHNQPEEDTSHVGLTWLEGDLGNQLVVLVVRLYRGFNWKALQIAEIMDTRSSTDLEKAIESLEAEKRAMADQLRTMQDQIHELSFNRRGDHEHESGGSGVN
ncbi:hypothetical protein E3N88_07127 [Mikania micrantha]|uniref:Uncharacterized protein n=1 Tax=Mikania micrantha TaxID=192012 RepID=A0A5N6PRD2_9ASTR|nr:hypothetical protein E3N88_07127 [Mikania micrantha]